MVWIGIGQETYECPKCDASGDVSKTVPSKKRSSAKKAKPKPRQSNSPSNLLVPAAQMQRLVRLIDETKAIFPKVSHREVFEVGLLLKSRVTYELLVNLHLHIEAEIVDVLRKTREIQSLLDEQKKDIEAAKIVKRNEGIAAWGVRRLRESVAGQPSLEATIQYSEMQEKELREIFGKLRLSEEPLRSIEKKFREILGTPAAKKWQTIPNLTLNQLERLETELASNSANAATNGIKTKKQVSKPKPSNSETDNLAALTRLYPELANDLADAHRKRKSLPSQVSHSATGVWLLGQSWLTFFDGSQFSSTDDIRIYNLISEMARQAPRCSVEEEASIFMHNVALNMTEFEMRIGLRIAVKKLGHGLVLNGNFDQTLTSLIRNRDRSNFEMIGK